jgi:ABC-2 type transport system ATP-binding protein
MLKEGRIIALDTTRNLLNRVAGVRVRLRLAPDVLPASLGEWRSDREGDSEVLQLPDYPTLEVVLAALRQACVEVKEMELLESDLEDVFVQMMRKHR